MVYVRKSRLGICSQVPQHAVLRRFPNRSYNIAQLPSARISHQATTQMCACCSSKIARESPLLLRSTCNVAAYPLLRHYLIEVNAKFGMKQFNMHMANFEPGANTDFLSAHFQAACKVSSHRISTRDSRRLSTRDNAYAACITHLEISSLLVVCKGLRADSRWLQCMVLVAATHNLPLP